MRFRDVGAAIASEPISSPPPPAAAPVPAPPPVPAPVPQAAAPVLGDSAANDVARTEPAAPPPPPPQVAAVPVPTPPPPPAIDPASVVGATSSALRERFGAPERQTPIGSGTTWHYEREACRASFVLLPELSSGGLRVFSYDIAPPDGALFGPAGCLGRIAAARTARTAGSAP